MSGPSLYRTEPLFARDARRGARARCDARPTRRTTRRDAGAHLDSADIVRFLTVPS
jgi:hypothetical protein